MLAQLSTLPASVAWFLAIWMFSLGACIGSFMNVVIYRLPAGLALAKPNSRCPKCLHPIRWYDNLPMLSWMFLLRAKCRDCGVAIPPRYPFVELLVASVFFLFGGVQGLEAGANLPVRFPLETSAASPWLAVGYHLLLITTLICVAFIEFDGHRPPWRLFAPALLVGVAGPLVWQDLRPIGIATPGWSFVATSLVESFGGAMIGAWMGWLSAGFRRHGELLDLRTPSLAAALVGLMLGWQAVVLLAAVVGVCWLLRLVLIDTSLAKVPWSGWFTAAVILLVVNWRSLSEGQPALVQEMGLAVFASACLLLVAARCVAQLHAAEPRRVRPQQSS